MIRYDFEIAGKHAVVLRPGRYPDFPFVDHQMRRSMQQFLILAARIKKESLADECRSENAEAAGELIRQIMEIIEHEGK